MDRFVHHNPLHALEDRPFEDAVVEAAQLLGTQPFLSEAAYREAWARGRIREVDLDAVIAREVADGPVAGVVDRRALARAVLLHPVTPLGGEALAWTLTETDALSALRPDLAPEPRARLLGEGGGDPARAVQRLWAVCEARREALPPVPAPPPRGVRVRDEILARTGRDADRLVHPILIRWCGAYLDQGVAGWSMSDRDQGFLAAFLAHFDQRVDIGRPWLGALRGLARRARSESWSAETLAITALERLGHPEADWDEVVVRTLLALRGWAGMFQRLADRPDLAPRVRLPTDLGEFLAVRLLLDLSAATHLLGGERDGTLLDRARAIPARPPGPPETDDPAWRLFQLAQALGIGASALRELSDARLAALFGEALAFDGVRRRLLWHLAYERRYRVEVLDALAVHTRRQGPVSTERRVQCVFCIDEREESLRRHLEEVAPWIETVGAAGNYGISMVWDGLDPGHPVALGPPAAPPRHLVREIAPRPRGEPWAPWLARLDLWSRGALLGALASLGGVLASVPLVVRLLAPRLRRPPAVPVAPAATGLQVERSDEPAPDGLVRGFTVDEMVGIVADILRSAGLARGAAPLVCLFGHGSHSLNNPHLAAYACGACGGGGGGPNARVFAWMANDPRVRAALRERGIAVPDETWFVGATHDTCDDGIVWHDLHRVPASARRLLDETRAALEEARRRNAHERCRRFESAPLDLDPDGALAHVERRARDLAQPRPEYGHARNALALIGRRRFSRGLFLDRRSFLVSYDPASDPDGAVLADLLGQVLPVMAGINLEYWFSAVDPTGYGSGSKLAHNITGLMAVMDGHQSDLRTGLTWQMVELHEPVRLLCVVEAAPALLERILARDPAVGRLVANGWVGLAALDPATGQLSSRDGAAFRPWQPESTLLPTVPSSMAWYAGARGPLPPASVQP